MSFKRNYRGCETFATPATEKYRDNYDRIFRGEPSVDAVATVTCALGHVSPAPADAWRAPGPCLECASYGQEAHGVAGALDSWSARRAGLYGFEGDAIRKIAATLADGIDFLALLAKSCDPDSQALKQTLGLAKRLGEAQRILGCVP